MTIEELFEYFPGGHIEAMAGQNILSKEEDTEYNQNLNRAKSMNITKMSIKKKLRKIRNRNKPWTKEQDMLASPTYSDHDLGQTDAAIKGLLKSSST
jgi:hypothetical protein